MVKKFSGQVRASEIKEEFDSLVARINTMINNYNSVAEGHGVDISVGSPNVGAYNYTLTIGALKKILKACDGITIGVKVFRTDTNKVIVTSGILIKNGRTYKIPETQLENVTETDIYFNLDNSTVSTSLTTNCLRIAYINMNRQMSDDVQTLPKVSLEDSSFRIKIRQQNPQTGYFNNLSRPVFLACGNTIADEGWSATQIQAWGKYIGGNSQAGHRSRQYYHWASFLYMPPQTQNPYTYNRTGDMSQEHIYEVDKNVPDVRVKKEPELKIGYNIWIDHPYSLKSPSVDNAIVFEAGNYPYLDTSTNTTKIFKLPERISMKWNSQSATGGGITINYSRGDQLIMGNQLYLQGNGTTFNAIDNSTTTSDYTLGKIFRYQTLFIGFQHK